MPGIFEICFCLRPHPTFYFFLLFLVDFHWACIFSVAISAETTGATFQFRIFPCNFGATGSPISTSALGDPARLHKTYWAARYTSMSPRISWGVFSLLSNLGCCCIILAELEPFPSGIISLKFWASAFDLFSRWPFCHYFSSLDSHFQLQVGPSWNAFVLFITFYPSMDLLSIPNSLIALSADLFTCTLP